MRGFFYHVPKLLERLIARYPGEARTLIIAALLALMCAIVASAAHGADALPWVNAQRAYFGLPPYQPSAALQAKAERDCQTRAAIGQTGHLRRGLAPGCHEGVGWGSHRDPRGEFFHSCYQANRSHRYAGAAVVVGRNGTYYQLLLGN